MRNSLRYITRSKNSLFRLSDYYNDIDDYSSTSYPVEYRIRRVNNLRSIAYFPQSIYFILENKQDLEALSKSNKNERAEFGNFVTSDATVIGGRNKMKYIAKVMNTPVIKEFERKLINQCVSKIKTTFGVQIKADYDPDNYKRFLTWVKKYDKSFKKHITKCPYKPYYYLQDQDLLLKVGEHTYARILTGNAIKNTLDEAEKYSNNIHIAYLSVRIYIFGKEAKKIAYQLEKISERECLEYYTITVSKETRNGVNVYRDIATGRNKESVFLNDHIKDDILNHIRKFFSNKEIYDKRNLTYKTGILLEGEPGTGKSTIASMIATEFKLSMVIINMNQFSKLDTDFITSTLNADDKTYVVLLEDIDCVIGDRESEDSDVENKKNVNKLLQFLDSASSPSNVIFVATTNHIDKLDDAIVRDGRFDLKVNISNINRDAATQMCKSFGIKDEETIKRIFNENSNNGRINPAKLQNLILKEIDHMGE